MTQQARTKELPHEEVNKPTQAIYAGLGTISLIGIVLILSIWVFSAGFNYVEIGSQIWSMFVHGPGTVHFENGTGILDTAVNVTGIMLATLALSIGISAITSKLTGGTKSFGYETLEKLIDKGPLVFFIGISGEEIFSRWLFLGALWALFGKSDIAFLILFLVGNGVFAIVHFANYKNRKEHSLLRIIPQFIAGISLTYIYLRYGLGIAILAHFYYDVILLITLKEQRPGIKTLLNIIYYIALGSVMALIMYFSGLGLGDLTPWLTETQLTPLAGYSFLNYVVVLLLVDSISALIGELLLLDHVEVNKEGLKKALNIPFLGALVTIAVIILVYVGIFFGLNWALSLFIKTPLTRTIIISIGLIFLGNSKSGSALARTTLVQLPAAFLMVAAFTTLGFWSAAGMVLAFYLAHSVPSYIRAYT